MSFPFQNLWAPLLGAVLLGPTLAHATAPVPQPAESAREREEEARKPTDVPLSEAHLRSWEAPAVPETVVQGARGLVEEERIGEYGQPRWTARRRFPTTRVYVVPAGTAQLEYWLETKTPLDDPADTRFRSFYELEVGLGHRLQLDFYLQTEQQGDTPWHVAAELVELRYAFADWGALPGNPTVYLEWARQSDGPNKGEVKLLLGDQLAPRWHWGANLVFERELSGATQGHEYAVTAAVSCSVLDVRLSVGLEAKVELVDVRNRRFDFDGYEVLAGPSLQWRPIKSAHVDLVALLGAETSRSDAGSAFHTSAIVEPTLVVGWEL